MSARLRVAALVLALGFATACGTTRGVAPPRREVSAPQRVVLANGMRVIVQEHRSADVVAVQLWVRAGARDESPAELGLAHYLEHMVFKGTPTRAPGSVDRDVESVGGRINAATALDYTYLHAVLPAARMRATVATMADLAVNATLDEALLENEKRIVLEEMRLRDDDPRHVLQTGLWALAFRDHVYGRPILGRPDGIRVLTRDTLVQFYRRHYAPEAFTLVVVGAVDADEALRAARDTFGRLPRAGIAELPDPAPPRASARRTEMRRPGTEAYLGLGWLGPRVSHADAPAMTLLAHVLGQARASRLATALRDRLALVDGIGCSYTAMELAGLVTVTAELASGNVADAEEEIVREVGRVREAGIAPAEWRRAVAAAQARYEFSVETAEGRAFSFGRAETIWTLGDELAWVDRLGSVTREQVQLVARRYLDPSLRVRMTVLPSAP